MNYPLHLSFKILALARQLSVTDAGGKLIYYVKQKAFKLKESVTVFADAEQTQPLYSINADKMLDFSARYTFTDHQGRPLGSVKRQGMKSLWKAHYDILDGETPLMTIKEESPWTKVLDSLVGEIPILGMFTGYLFHPAYLVTRQNGAVVMRLEKQPAFFEGKYVIQKQGEMERAEEERALLSLLMMILLERHRG
ncbi:MAG TPA: hypothetical protein VF708_04365 [Pyrinomonadaceae bacterium]|jgi:hypothetical protein